MKLSVITINYNNAKGLSQTFQSVFSQSFTDFDYLVIDGGSSDDSVNIIKRHEDKITYWVSEQDKGIYNAMNKGIKAANTEYVIFLNSGDEFYNIDALSHFKPYLNNDKSDLVYGNLNVIDKSGWIKKDPAKLGFRYLFRDTLPHMPTLTRKSCFDNFLYDEDLQIVSDWKFYIIGILKRKFTYKHIDVVISNFYLGGVSTTLGEVSTKERIQVINHHFYVKHKLLMLIRSIKSIVKKKYYYDFYNCTIIQPSKICRRNTF